MSKSDLRPERPEFLRFFLQVLLAGLMLTLCACRTNKPVPGVFDPTTPDEVKEQHPPVAPGLNRFDPPRPHQPEIGEYSRIEEVDAYHNPPHMADGREVFLPEIQSSAQEFASPDAIGAFSEGVQKDYKMGPGDIFAFLVRGREDISREEVVVAPDGLVALPRIGVFNIKGMTVPQATDFVRERLLEFYEEPEVTLALSYIDNNKVFVLGRVANPGAVRFSGQGTLLEALSLSGGLPADTRLSFLSRCMIVRGSEMLIWVDLRDLLENGNLALNTKLQNGDFIFIPQSEDQLAYIMGSVRNPGVLVLRSQMTVLDAIMQSGGVELTAKETQVYLIRNTEGKGHVMEIDMTEMYKRGDLRQNYVLKDGDIIYVSNTRLGEFNEVVTQLIPGMAAIDFSINTLEAFGVMQELRNRIWGQEGFVNRTSTTTSSASGGE